MAKKRNVYECNECGHQSAKWLGMCPSCESWHTFEEVSPVPDEPAREHAVLGAGIGEDAPVPLSEVSVSSGERMASGIGELDRVLGGGFVGGSLNLLGGDPGIGKSTLMLQVAGARPELNILYVAGEESAGQIKQRAGRVGIHAGGLKITTATELDRVLTHVRNESPDLLVIDSIQTVYRSRLGSLPGSVQQIRECAALLQKLAKQQGVTTVMIGHMNKDGEIAGPKILEHMVDSVLRFEGDQTRVYRLLRGVKNRFGATGEVGVFEMAGQGLKEIANPSALFLPDEGVQESGSVVTCVMEGSRALLVEVQALVTTATYPVPQRTASGFDQKRLALLLAVLEKRAGVDLSGHDVYLNIAGGIRIQDPAADLAVVAAVVSSFRDIPVSGESVWLGEVGLGGEVRRVPQTEARMKEVSKLGFQVLFAPKSEGEVPDGLEYRQVSRISAALSGLQAT
ncbi:MAG: DNA repair protein RadA [Balneolaceae bacterium]